MSFPASSSHSHSAARIHFSLARSIQSSFDDNRRKKKPANTHCNWANWSRAVWLSLLISAMALRHLYVVGLDTRICRYTVRPTGPMPLRTDTDMFPTCDCLTYGTAFRPGVNIAVLVVCVHVHIVYIRVCWALSIIGKSMTNNTANICRDSRPCVSRYAVADVGMTRHVCLSTTTNEHDTMPQRCHCGKTAAKFRVNQMWWVCGKVLVVDWLSLSRDELRHKHITQSAISAVYSAMRASIQNVWERQESMVGSSDQRLVYVRRLSMVLYEALYCGRTTMTMPNGTWHGWEIDNKIIIISVAAIVELNCRRNTVWAWPTGHAE